MNGSDADADADGPRPRLAVRVTRDAERQVRGGHPWVFDASIRTLSGGGRAGDLAVVFDEKRRFVAIGLYDPLSPIRVKLLHAGEPRRVDAAFWAEQIDRALALRAPLARSATTDAYRCVNGENDGFPGLVIDRYAEAAVVKVYAACWFPHLDSVLDAFMARTAVSSVVLRLARRLEVPLGMTDGMTLRGRRVEREVEFLENGLHFAADLVDGHKTGHFLDQRDNRQRVRALAAGRDVLDVFACTGGFSVYAAAGGARSVTSVDISQAAVDAIAENLARNATAGAPVAASRQICGDAIVVMDDLFDRRERFDVVIIDPPSFAQKQSSIPLAERAYLRLNRRAISLVRDGGLLVSASCSSRIDADHFFELVHAAADDERVTLRDADYTGHAVDHPVTFEQGAYLKAVFARVRR